MIVPAETMRFLVISMKAAWTNGRTHPLTEMQFIFMVISCFSIKKGGGGVGFEIRYCYLFLVPAPKQTRPDTRPSIACGWAGAAMPKNRRKNLFFTKG